LSMRIAEEQSRHERFGDPASMVMIDMANFKLINDTYGHLVGDKVLKSFASLLSECVRAGDIAGRFGGDEFLLILPGTVQKQAFHLVKRLQSSLEALHVEGVLHNISADFGVATVPEDASSLHEALKIADDRMYQSKVERRRRQEENKGT
ncbi:MAG: GGDEF domain-containing protein, partial [Aminobacterium colombiense]|nr:GGDEF domain-containing protein [Aminobacterium colombiense]